MKYLALLIIQLMVCSVGKSQQPAPVLYAPCNNCNSSNHNKNNQNFEYGQITPFNTSHVVSDFGPRNYGGYDWHGGVDFNKCAGAGDSQELVHNSYLVYQESFEVVNI